MKYDIYTSSNEFILLDWQFADMVVRRCDGDDDLRLLAIHLLELSHQLVVDFLVLHFKVPFRALPPAQNSSTL